MPAALITPGTAYTITVGEGGASTAYPTRGPNGENSSAFGATAAGGGGSGVYNTGIGYAGGSGGGAAANDGELNQGGASSGSSLGSNSGTIYGNRGGNMLNTRAGFPTAAAGGGGAGTAAADVNCNIVLDSPGTAQGRGGDGIPNSILGTLYYWGGGGGGGAFYNGYAGNGGLGGGGGGSCSAGTGPTAGGESALNAGAGAIANVGGGNGGANTGGGGGGGAWQATSGGAGGSGIVVVRYPGSRKASGGTITSVDGHTIHTFTTSGIFTPGIGTLTNGVGFNAANVGSLVFDGSNDEIIISPNDLYKFTNTQPFSFSTWLRYTNIGGAATIISFSLNNEPSRGYYLMLIEPGVDNRFFFDYWDGGPFRGIQGNLNSIFSNEWIYLVATSSSNSVNDMKVYQNGILTSFTNRGSDNPSTIDYNELSLKIGSRGGAYFFQGSISQVSIYNRALTSAEVLQNYNATKGRFLL